MYDYYSASSDYALNGNLIKRCNRLRKLYEFVEDYCQPDNANNISIKKIQTHFRNDEDFVGREEGKIVTKNTLIQDIALLLPLYGIEVSYDHHIKGYSIVQEKYDEDEIKNANNVKTAVSKALNTHVIEFKYFHSSLRKYNKTEKEYSKNYDSFKVYPFSLYSANGHDYMRAYDLGSESFRVFRLDRIDYNRMNFIAHTHTKPTPSVKDLCERERVKDTSSKVFNNWYSNDIKRITLLCRNNLADYIKEEFDGQALDMYPTEDGRHFSVLVKVQISPPFYAWVSSFRGGIVITSPDDVIDEMVKFLGSSLRKHKSLQKDKE